MLLLQGRLVASNAVLYRQLACNLQLWLLLVSLCDRVNGVFEYVFFENGRDYVYLEGFVCFREADLAEFIRMVAFCLLPALYLALQQGAQLRLLLQPHLDCYAEIGFNFVCETDSVFQHCLSLAFPNAQAD